MRVQAHSGRSWRRSGFTLLESMIALTLLFVVIGSVVLATQRGTELYETQAVNGDINARAARAANRILKELSGAGRNSLAPDLTTPAGTPTVWSSSLDYRSAAEWKDDDIVWSTVTRIGLQLAQGEADNGLDDNGNGLVDERDIVRIEDPDGANPVTVVLVRGVSELLEGETADLTDENGNGMVDEQGLCFELNEDNLLTIHFTLQRIGLDQQLVTRTQQVSMSLRN